MNTVGGGGSVTKSRPTLATPWTAACQAPLSTGILQARILERVAISFSHLNTAILIWHYQRNANQNYDEVSPHTGQNGLSSENLQTVSAEEGVEKREPSCIIGGNVN